MLKKYMLVLIMFILAVSPFIAPPQAEAAVTYDGTSQAEQQKGLDYLNRLRAGMGLSPLKLDPALSKAAVNHARYVSAHYTRDMKANFSLEEAGRTYFTQATPEARAAAAGYTGSAKRIEENILLESESYDGFDMAENMRSMSLLHSRRTLIVNPNTVSVGIAHVGKATILIGAVKPSAAAGEPVQVSMFPYNAMSEAMIISNGFMDPKNPLAGEGMEITVHSNRPDVSGMSATLQRQAGSRLIDIPLTVKRMDTGEGYSLTAQRPLRGDTVYTARVAFETGGERVEKEWKFRTIPFKYELYIDDMPVFYAPPLSFMNDRATVPMRFLFERFGASVQWDKATQTITANQGGRTVQMTIGSNTATIDGKTVVLDSPPRLHNYTTNVPLRFIAEAFGYEVGYNAAERSVDIWTGLTDQPQ